MKVRKNQALGFYPEDPDTLYNFLDLLFGSAQKEEKYDAGIVPHAGYIYSGRVAANFYAKLKGNKKSIIILGVDHFGNCDDICTSIADLWQTPLGFVEVDQELREIFIKKLNLKLNDTPREHSIEVQLPFLQYIYHDFTFLPITVPNVSLDRMLELASLIKELREDIIVIASSDLDHQEFIDKEVLEERDKIAINFILKNDWENLIEYVYRGYNMCGFRNAVVLMNSFEDYKRELVSYTNSAYITGNEDYVVGYASIGFWK